MRRWTRRGRRRRRCRYPLLFRGELLGVVAMFARRELTQAELAPLARFANRAAIAVQNTLTHAELAAGRFRADLSTGSPCSRSPAPRSRDDHARPRCRDRTRRRSARGARRDAAVNRDALTGRASAWSPRMYDQRAHAEVTSARDRLTKRVWSLKTRPRSCGSNSVVECNLAKVDVAGSNPVSRSTASQEKAGRAHARTSLLFFHRRTQAATPPRRGGTRSASRTRAPGARTAPRRAAGTSGGAPPPRRAPARRSARAPS